MRKVSHRRRKSKEQESPPRKKVTLPEQKEVSESGRERAEGGEKGRREGAPREADRVHQRERKAAPWPSLCLRYESEWDNRWERLGIPWERRPEGLGFQDALGLAVIALRPGWEDQDLGLPLLHVLGKNSGVLKQLESRSCSG